MSKLKLNYDDVTLVPEVITKISSRSECNPYDADGYLPIFASPMSSVISMENVNDFNKSKIRVVIPRSYSLEERFKFLFNDTDNFVAFSLDEAEKVFINDVEYKKSLYFGKTKDGDGLTHCYANKFKICVDIANGHMEKLIDICKKIKEMWDDNVVIMAGNVANPKVYKYYEEAGIDYLRAGIGRSEVPV